MPADIEIPKHRKKRSTQKKFIIEYRSAREMVWSWCKEWATHSKYLTEKQRDQALQDLQSKTSYGKMHFEYRAKP